MSRLFVVRGAAWLSTALVLSIVCATAGGALAGDDPQKPSLYGKAAPPIKLKTVQGGTFDLAKAKGKKFTVIHFGTSWCPYCNAEAPYLEKLYQDYKSKGVQVVVIDVKEPPSLIKKWMKRVGYTLPILLDADGKVSASYAPPEVAKDSHLPPDQIPIGANLIIDKAGKIQFYSLLDSRGFDAKLIALTAKLNELLSGRAAAPVRVEPPKAVTLRHGASTDARVVIDVAGGYHVQANPAANEFLIPLVVEVAGDRHVAVSKPVYPKGKKHQLEGDDEPLLVYGGRIEVPVALTLKSKRARLARNHKLSGRVSYQACNDSRCFAPTDVPFQFSVKVARK